APEHPAALTQATSAAAGRRSKVVSARCLPRQHPLPRASPGQQKIRHAVRRQQARGRRGRSDPPGRRQIAPGGKNGTCAPRPGHRSRGLLTPVPRWRPRLFVLTSPASWAILTDAPPPRTTGEPTMSFLALLLMAVPDDSADTLAKKML